MKKSLVCMERKTTTKKSKEDKVLTEEVKRDTALVSRI